MTAAAVLDNVQIWDATPSPAWPAEQAKLRARQAVRPALDRSDKPTEAFHVAEVKARDRHMKADAKGNSLADSRATIQQAIAKACPVVNLIRDDRDCGDRGCGDFGAIGKSTQEE